MSTFIIFFGAPGVGKGTQAAILAEKKGYAHLSTGDAFRAAISQQTEVGKIAKSYVDGGGLVPDEIVTRIVEEAVTDEKYAGTVILDGFPRTIGQAEAFAELAAKKGDATKSVVNITVAEDDIVTRLLSRGRKDDTEEIIRHRLSVYEKETAPLLDYYNKLGIVVNIDGNADVDTVQQRIIDALGV